MSFQLKQEKDRFLMSTSAASFLRGLEKQIEKDYQTSCDTKETSKRLAFHILYKFTVDMETLVLDEWDREKVRQALFDIEDKVFSKLEEGTWQKTDWAQLRNFGGR